MPTIHDAPPSDVSGWRRLTDDETDREHVMPMFGPKHAFHPCWCHPVIPPDEHQLVIHNAPQ